MNGYILAIDQGTTSTRCMIFNHSGKPISQHQREHHQFFPLPGWVEHDPMEIMKSVEDVCLAAMEKGSITNKEILSIGITNQRETTVIWDRLTGKPYCNAIVWQDTRTDQICDHLAREGGQDRFRKISGLPIATYFSGMKIKWILDNIPGVRKAAEKGQALFGNMDTWMVWNLTGGANGGIHVTDVTNASRTMLMNLHSLNWDKGILESLDIPEQMLPEIKPSSSPLGETKGFLNKIPISGILGDQQAALFGQTCFDEGDAKNTYGTGCFLLQNTGTSPVESKHGLLTTLGYQIGKQPAVYCLEGSVAISGALVQWLRDNLGLIEKSEDIEKLALSVADNGGMYFVPAFSGLFAPYWRSDARGAITGLTRYVNKGHFARAALEATAYQTREVLEAMELDSKVHLKRLKVDGGMVFNDTLMQFQADILAVPVIRPVIAETTSLGAAYAAGIAVGFWGGIDELRANWEKAKEWTPVMNIESREKLFAEWKKAVSKTLNWIE
jgi:glycerol kinase